MTYKILQLKGQLHSHCALLHITIINLHVSGTVKINT